MVKEGYYFGVPPVLLGGIAIVGHWWLLGAVLAALGLFCFSFFRDPEREITSDPAAIVSPADGRVVVITEEENAGRAGTRISIFLAIWNVHVNRSPAAGGISKGYYLAGKIFCAGGGQGFTPHGQNTFYLAKPDRKSAIQQICWVHAAP